MKFLIILALGIVAWRMFTGRWIWDSLGLNAGPSPSEKARKLLGVHKNATHGDIVDAHRRLVARVHPDRGGTAEEVHEANAARDLLIARLPDRQEKS